MGYWHQRTGKSETRRKVNPCSCYAAGRAVSTWAPSGWDPEGPCGMHPMGQKNGAFLHCSPSPMGQGLLFSEELTPLYFKVCTFVRMWYVTPAEKPQSRRQEMWEAAEVRCSQVTLVTQLSALETAGVKKWLRGYGGVWWGMCGTRGIRYNNLKTNNCIPILILVSRSSNFLFHLKHFILV